MILLVKIDQLVLKSTTKKKGGRNKRGKTKEKDFDEFDRE
jgi:hypothetical protein